MKHIPPLHQQARNNNTATILNPISYQTDYFGHKLHLDLNKKLVMYGVMLVSVVNGHSRFVTAAKCMATKTTKWFIPKFIGWFWISYLGCFLYSKSWCKAVSNPCFKLRAKSWMFWFYCSLKCQLGFLV